MDGKERELLRKEVICPSRSNQQQAKSGIKCLYSYSNQLCVQCEHYL